MKKIDPRLAAVQHTLFADEHVEQKKPRPRKKTDEVRRPEPLDLRLERMYTTREAVEKVLAEEIKANGGEVPARPIDPTRKFERYIVGRDGQRVKASELAQKRYSNEKVYIPRGSKVEAEPAPERELTAEEKAYAWCVDRIAKLRQQHRISYKALEKAIADRFEAAGVKPSKSAVNFAVYEERVNRASSSTLSGAASGVMWAAAHWSKFSTAERAHVFALFDFEGDPDVEGLIVSEAGLAAIKAESLRLVKLLAERLPPPDLDEHLWKNCLPEVLHEGGKTFHARPQEVVR